MGRREEEEWEESDKGILDNWEEELEEPKPAPKPEPKPVAKKVTAVKEVEVFESEGDRKRRLEQAVKRSDLQNTMDLFGVTGEEVDIDGVLKEEAGLLSLSERPAGSSRQLAGGLLESSNPQSIPEFEKYADSIAAHLSTAFGDRKNYVSFLESLLRRLLSVRDITELRKLSGLVQDLLANKQKEQQRAPAAPAAPATATKVAPAAPAKKKPALLMGAKKGRDLDYADYDDDEVFDE